MNGNNEDRTYVTVEVALGSAGVLLYALLTFNSHLRIAPTQPQPSNALWMVKAQHNA